MLLGGLQLLSAGFWLCSWVQFADEEWPSVGSLRGMAIAVLLFNALLSAYAVRTKSERGALLLFCSFGLLAVLLGVSVLESHPASCARDDVEDEKTPLGPRRPPCPDG